MKRKYNTRYNKKKKNKKDIKIKVKKKNKKKITQIRSIDSEIIANNCFSKFDWILFYISKLVETIVLGHWDNVLGRPSPSHFAGTLSHTITAPTDTEIQELISDTNNQEL